MESPVELKYGFCQDLAELENLEVNNTVSEYSAYDLENEFEELLPKFEKVYPEQSDWGVLNTHFSSEVCPDCEYTSAQDVLNHHNEFLIEQGLFPHEPLCDLNAFDFDLRIPRDHVFFNERQNVYEVLEKYQNLAIKNKSIIKLSLPENLDKKKEIYIKVSSEMELIIRNM